MATDTRVFHITYRGGDGNDVVVRRGFPPVTTLSVRAFGDSAMRVQGSGVAGETYAIEGSTDLKIWAHLGTAVADETGVMQFIDTEASEFAERFYRIRSP
jgi:hypothetical protein